MFVCSTSPESPRVNIFPKKSNYGDEKGVQHGLFNPSATRQRLSKIQNLRHKLVITTLRGGSVIKSSTFVTTFLSKKSTYEQQGANFFKFPMTLVNSRKMHHALTYLHTLFWLKATTFRFLVNKMKMYQNTEKSL